MDGQAIRRSSKEDIKQPHQQPPTPARHNLYYYNIFRKHVAGLRFNKYVVSKMYKSLKDLLAERGKDLSDLDHPPGALPSWVEDAMKEVISKHIPQPKQPPQPKPQARPDPQVKFFRHFEGTGSEEEYNNLLEDITKERQYALSMLANRTPGCSDGISTRWRRTTLNIWGGNAKSYQRKTRHLKKLPKSGGVYLFQVCPPDADHKVDDTWLNVYLGKGDNLRARVASYLYGYNGCVLLDRPGHNKCYGILSMQARGFKVRLLYKRPKNPNKAPEQSEAELLRKFKSPLNKKDNGNCCIVDISFQVTVNGKMERKWLHQYKICCEQVVTGAQVNITEVMFPEEVAAEQAGQQHAE